MRFSSGAPILRTMRIAIVDLGTNSVRFDAYEVRRGRARRIFREKVVLRLGEDVYTLGRVGPRAVKRTLQAFHSFRTTLRALHITRVVAFATSALRVASNRDQVVELLRKETGISVQVISGAEEARLIALGILANEQLPKGVFALVDIGGGSTEVSICRGRGILKSVSLPLGAIRLHEVFLKKTPPKASALLQMRTYVRAELEKKLSLDGVPAPKMLIGSSGTARALARLLTRGRPGDGFETRDLHRLNARMAEMSREEILTIPLMEPKRADIILAGAVLLEEIAGHLRLNTLKSTEFSLRDGIIEDEVGKIRLKAGSRLALHLDDIRAKAVRFGAQENRVSKAVEISELLFEKLRTIHRLGTAWRPYLVAAAMLKDAGESIGLSDTEKHSYYIAKNADIPSIEPWESEFIAQLCRYHRTSKINMKDLPFRREPSRLRAFVNLLAILQVVDALDRGYQRRKPLAGVSVSSKRVCFKFDRRTVTNLEWLRLEQKKKLFESVFKRAVEVAET